VPLQRGMHIGASPASNPATVKCPTRLINTGKKSHRHHLPLETASCPRGSLLLDNYPQTKAKCRKVYKYSFAIPLCTIKHNALICV